MLHVLLTAVCIICCLFSALPIQCDPATNDQCITRPSLTTRESNVDYDGYIVEILGVTHVLDENVSSEISLELHLRSSKEIKEFANVHLVEDLCRNRLVVNYFCESYLLLVEDCNTLNHYAEQLTRKILHVEEVMEDFHPCIFKDIYTVNDEVNNRHRDFHSIDIMVYSKAMNDMNVIPTVMNPNEMINAPFPIIWTMWWQGWQFSPPVAQKCIESWRQHHPNWPLILLDKDNVESYFSIQKFLPHLNLTLTTGKNIVHYSDIIRLGLLYHYGGVWTDATVMCHKPLEWFIWNPAPGFFAFDNTLGLNMISTWFLASTSNSYIVQQLLEETIKYWTNRNEAEEYFWLNDLFMSLYQTDEEFRRIWDIRPKLPHDTIRLTHLMQQLMFEDPKFFATPLQRFVYNPEIYIPMSKLTWKFNDHEISKRSVLNLLLTNQQQEEREIGSKGSHQIMRDGEVTSVVGGQNN